MKKLFCVIFAVIILIALNSCDQSDPEMLKHYRVHNRSISPGKDIGGVHLNSSGGGGLAWIKGRKFKYGTIEFDAKGKDEFQASFVGIAFHGVNDTTFESVYFRPFNFRAADPSRKAHSVQYVALPHFDWSTLREKHPGEYEQPVSPAPDPNSWFHVRITVASKNISVYVNGAMTASLSVEPLMQTDGEWIGYLVGTGSAGDWKNFKITSAN
jgi:hypothetical protein